jgi:hypothetical protein
MTEGATSKAALPALRIAVGIQVVALVLTGGAVIWGCWMIYVAIYPGNSGEFGGVSVLLAAAIDIPVGLAALLVGLVVKRGRPILRRASIVLSIVALALPFLTNAAWHSHLIPK